MVRFFLNIYDVLRHHRGLTIGLLAAVSCGLLMMVSSMKYNENIYDFLPVSGNEQKAITLYQDITGGQRIYVLFSQRDDSLSSAQMTAPLQQGSSQTRQAEAVDTFAQKLMAGPGRRHISELTTQVDFEKVVGITDFVYQNIPLMLTDSDYVRMEGIVASPEAVDRQLADAVQLMMIPATGFFTSSIGNDPLGLFSPVLDRLQGRQSVMTMELDDGYIFTPGGKYAIAMLTSPYGAMESANNNALVGYVDSVAQQTMQALPDVEVSATGSPVIAVGNASQIKTDSQWAISIAVTLILLLLMFSFRKVKNLLLIGLAIVFGWLFAMGFIAVMRSDVSLIVLGIGSIIIGIAVNYPLHFIAHTSHGGTVRDVLKEMVAPLLIGNITTVGAFASLMPLNAPALRDLGFFAAFMLVGTILFVLVFLPHLVKSRVQASEERLSFGKIASMSPERHRWLLWAILILTPVFGYFSLGTSFDTNMHNINYMTAGQEQLLSDLRSSAGLSDTAMVYVVTEGDTWDEALRQRRHLAPVLDSLKTAGRLTAYTDVTAFICDSAEQQRRIERWNSFWAAHRERVLGLLAQKAPQYGFSNDAFTGFSDIITDSYSPRPFDHFDALRAVLLSSSFSTSTGRPSVVDVIDTRNSDMVAVEETLNNSQRFMTNAPFGQKTHVGGGVKETSNVNPTTLSSTSVYAFDFQGMNSAIAASLSDDFNYIGFACGFIVFIFLWLSFGRLELSLLAFLPMAIGWLWILGIMNIFDMRFNIVNVILATFIFGQGDDYTIFITDGLVNEYAYRKQLLPSYKNSIVISALIMFIGMGSLIVSRHPALHSLAEVTIVGMSTVVLMAWIVPPLVFGWLVKTDGRIRRVPVTVEQLVRTAYFKGACLLLLAVGSIMGLALRLIPLGRKKEVWMQQFVSKSLRVILRGMRGVCLTLDNERLTSSDGTCGSMMVARQHSPFDALFLLALSLKVIVAVQGDGRNNSLLSRLLLRLLRPVNANQPEDALKDDMAEAIADGYNVVMLTAGVEDEERAFRMAVEIGADILPVYIHGTDLVMPEGSGFVAKGQVDVETGERVGVGELRQYGASVTEQARQLCAMYEAHREERRKELETTHYYHDYLVYKYTYKGIGIEKETRKLLRQHDDFSKWIDGYRPADAASNSVSVINAGRGQFALLFALVHPDMEVNAYAYDADDVALVSACSPMPRNLHVHHSDDEKTALQAAENGNIINLSNPL